jgi:isocitrate dehydrogenase
MFEAIHGSAPRRAGQNMANPSGLLLGAVMMLVHIGQSKVAERVHNAWLRTIEDGIHTYDIYTEGVSKEKVGTKEFAQAVVARLGQNPKTLKTVTYKASDEGGVASHEMHLIESVRAIKVLVGVDVFLDWTGTSANELAEKLTNITVKGLELKIITNRGVKVWPEGMAETFNTDHWRCRFQTSNGHKVTHADLVELLGKFAEAGLDFVEIESLYNFDGVQGYTQSYGQ